MNNDSRINFNLTINNFLVSNKYNSYDAAKKKNYKLGVKNNNRFQIMRSDNRFKSLWIKVLGLLNIFKTDEKSKKALFVKMTKSTENPQFAAAISQVKNSKGIALFNNPQPPKPVQTTVDDGLLKAKLDESEKRVEQKDAEIKKLKLTSLNSEQAKEMKGLLAFALKEKQALEAEIKSLKERNEANPAESRIELLLEMIGNTELQKEGLEEEITRLKDQIKAFNDDQVENLKFQEILANSLATSENEVKTMREYYKTNIGPLREQINALENENVDQLEANLIQQEEMKAAYEEKIVNLRKRLEAFEDVEVQNGELEEQLKALQLVSSNDRAKASKSAESLQAEIASLKEELEYAEKKKLELEAEIKELENIKPQIAELQVSIETLKQRTEAYAALETQLGEEKAVLEAEIDTLNIRLEELQTVEKQKIALESEFSKLTKAYQDKTVEFEKLESDFTDLTLKCLTQDNKIRKLNEQLEEIDLKKTQTTETPKKLKQLGATRKDLERLTPRELADLKTIAENDTPISNAEGDAPTS